MCHKGFNTCATNMGSSRSRRGASLELAILLLLFACSSICPSPSDATRIIPRFTQGDQSAISLIQQMEKMRVAKNLDLPSSSNTEPYGVSSPFTLPPYESSPPIPLPDLSPPSCIFPPFPPQHPYSPTPSTPYVYFPPVIPIPNPPPSPPSCIFPPFTPQHPYSPTPSTPYVYFPPRIPIPNPPPSPPASFPSPNPPETVPRPPIPGTVPSSPIPRTTPCPSVPGATPSPSIPGITPSPSVPRTVPSPPLETSPPFHIPSPPTFAAGPPSYVPSPGGGGIMPCPRIFHPPTVPPPPKLTPSIARWCVVKPSVPDPIVQEAMNYACGSGADCSSIQPEGSCFQPNTLFAHASYAFNSYWQRTKDAGGTCSFGGTAVLVTVDPSYNGCHFVYY